MTNLHGFRNVFLAAALLVAPAACNKDKTGKESDRAAERVNDGTKDLRSQTRDVVETAKDRRDHLSEKARDNAGDIADEAKDVGEQAKKLGAAQGEFAHMRMVRLATLRGVHAVMAQQPMLIISFASGYPIVEADRAKVNEKLQIFQMRLDEAGNLIQGLEGVEAATWEQRHDDANKAMGRLEDSRAEAWKALHDAKRLEKTSMR
ncbi:MAG: YtxH domain-containing protein [Myxococcales bacterium]|nr:YtxH domain-containing protein [Myxococcales bacterium]